MMMILSRYSKHESYMLIPTKLLFHLGEFDQVNKFKLLNMILIIITRK